MGEGAPKVMSTFACGGGSSMGYKRAGMRVVAANDIDPKMAKHYKQNLTVPHYLLAPIGDVVKRAKAKDLPADLYDLDILDGSPPCTTFSSHGKREKVWGVEKNFTEGSTKQVLSDLFFDYLDLVEALQPKVSIAENVKGMITGNAKGYVRLIMDRYKAMGYKAQLFLVDGVSCGVPQHRERVFFVARRQDVMGDPLRFSPSHRPITVREAWADLGEQCTDGLQLKPSTRPIWRATKRGRIASSVGKLLLGVHRHFSLGRLDMDSPSLTLIANGRNNTHPDHPRNLTSMETIRLGSFPDDYSVDGGPNVTAYIVGMSVPPPMTEEIARAVEAQWLRYSAP